MGPKRGCGLEKYQQYGPEPALHETELDKAGDDGHSQELVSSLKYLVFLFGCAL